MGDACWIWKQASPLNYLKYMWLTADAFRQGIPSIRHYVSTFGLIY